MGGAILIFVTLGTHPLPFDRLLRRIDQLCEDDLITERVFAQIGNSTYRPKNYSYERFVPADAFRRLLNESSVVITHGGAGTIMQCVRMRKLTIAVPREAVFREHVDDHQKEVVYELATHGYIIAATVDSMHEAIATARQFVPRVYSPAPRRASDLIREFLLSVSGEMRC